MSTQRTIEELAAHSADELLACAARSIYIKGASEKAPVAKLANLFVDHFSTFITTVRDYFPEAGDSTPEEEKLLPLQCSTDDKHGHLHSMFLTSACLIMESQLLQNSGASKETIIHQIRRAQSELLIHINSEKYVDKDKIQCRCNKVGASHLMAPEDFYHAVAEKSLPSLITLRLEAVLKDPDMGITWRLDELRRPLDYILKNGWFFSLHAQDPKPPHVLGYPSLAMRRRTLLTTAREPSVV